MLHFVLNVLGAHLGFDFPGVWVHFDIAAPVSCVSYCLSVYKLKTCSDQGVNSCPRLAGGTCHRIWGSTSVDSVW